MWRGNSRLYAIYYDIEDQTFRNNAGDKINPFGIMNKPNLSNKVFSYMIDKYKRSLKTKRKLKVKKK